MQQAGVYCDAMGHCFATPQALAGHISRTGHPKVQRRQKTPAGEAKRNPFRDRRKKKVEDKSHDDDLRKLGIEPNDTPWYRVQKEVELPPEWEDVDLKELKAKVDEKMSDREALFQAKEDLAKVKKELEFDFVSPGTLFAEMHDAAAEDLVYQAWGSSAKDPDTAALWAYASKTYNVDIIEDMAKGHREVTAEQMAVVGALAKKSQSMTRLVDPTYDPKTDTVLIFRGVGDKMGKELEDAKRAGETIQAKHRAIESWSVDPDVASSFGNVVIQARVPVVNIVAAFHTTKLFSRREVEYVVATPRGAAVYKPENILVAHDPQMDFHKVNEMKRMHTKAWVAHNLGKEKAERPTLPPRQPDVPSEGDKAAVELGHKSTYVANAHKQLANHDFYLEFYSKNSDSFDDEHSMKKFVSKYVDDKWDKEKVEWLGQLTGYETQALKEKLVDYLKTTVKSISESDT